MVAMPGCVLSTPAESMAVLKTGDTRQGPVWVSGLLAASMPVDASCSGDALPICNAAWTAWVQGVFAHLTLVIDKNKKYIKKKPKTKFS